MNQEFQAGTAKPVTAWSIFREANNAVILQVAYLEQIDPEAPATVVGSIQLALTPQQGEELSAALAKAAMPEPLPPGTPVS